jgi:hypothetical protein
MAKLREDIIEYYTLVLLIAGLPLVAFVYWDWRAALTVFIVVQIVLGVMIVFRSAR